MTLTSELVSKLVLGAGTTLISFVGELPQIDLGDRHALVIVEDESYLPEEGYRPKARVLRVGPKDCLEAQIYPFLVVNQYRYQILVPKDLDPYRKTRLDSLLQFLRSTGINMSTVNAFGGMFSENIIRNTPEILKASSVTPLRGTQAGRPAVLIASGPSLNQAIPALRSFKDKGVLIAADSLVSFLPAQGVDPDFFVSVDPQRATYDKQGGATSSAALFFHPSVFHLIPREWKGPLLTTATHMAPYQILQLPDHGHIEEDVQCQMHLAFNLAAWMGCDPIILTGQDLCYHGDRMYAEGAQYLGAEDASKIMAGTYEKKNIRGEAVRTTIVFESYHATFERKIRSFHGKVYNATPGGVLIDGAENVDLDVMQQRCENSAGFSVPKAQTPAPPPEAMGIALKQLSFLNDCLMVSMGVLPGEEKLLNMVRAVRETIERIEG